jgi:hypothetical protein
MMSAEVDAVSHLPEYLDHSSPLAFAPESSRLFYSRRPIYSFDWSPNSSKFCSLAVGSFIASSGVSNIVELASLTDPQSTDFQVTCPAIPHQFPSTKVQFSPNRVSVVCLVLQFSFCTDRRRAIWILRGRS